MANQNIKDKLDRLGNALVSGFQVVALFVIGARSSGRRRTTTSG